MIEARILTFWTALHSGGRADVAVELPSVGLDVDVDVDVGDTMVDKRELCAVAVLGNVHFPQQQQRRQRR